MLKIRVLPCVQNGTTYYVGVAKVGAILQNYAVDVWSPANQGGYQRDVSKPRARAFGRFIAKGGNSPATILINVRDVDLVERGGMVELPTEHKAWLVDGQHRVVGLSEVQNEFPHVLDVEFPVIITNFRDSYDEAMNFLIFNKTQKGVRPDLAERIIQEAIEKRGKVKLTNDREQGVIPRSILSDLEWRPKATNIMDRLNADERSAFYQRVRFPNSPKGETVVNEISITDSLKPILKDEILGDFNTENLASALINYWGAIKSLCPDAFDNHAEYVIQKTTGVFALHQVFTTVARYCRRSDGAMDLREETILGVLSQVPEQFAPEFWHSDGTAGLMGSSRKSYAAVAGLIRDAIAEKIEQAEMGMSVMV